MDFSQLLEELVIVLVAIEIVELIYHFYEMRRYEKHIEQHLRRMDAHIQKMDAFVNELESQRTKADPSLEQGNKKERES